MDHPDITVSNYMENSIGLKRVNQVLVFMLQTEGPESMESWYSDHLVTEETNAKVSSNHLTSILLHLYKASVEYHLYDWKP